MTIGKNIIDAECSVTLVGRLMSGIYERENIVFIKSDVWLCLLYFSKSALKSPIKYTALLSLFNSIIILLISSLNIERFELGALYIQPIIWFVPVISISINTDSIICH